LSKKCMCWFFIHY